MPTQNFSADLTTRDKQEIASPGNQILSINILASTVGVPFRVKIGNSPPIGPFIGAGPEIIGIALNAGTPDSDRVRGAWIIAETPTPGAVVEGFISYGGAGL